jgi:hypothetical protein
MDHAFVPAPLGHVHELHVQLRIMLSDSHTHSALAARPLAIAGIGTHAEIKPKLKRLKFEAV